MAYAKCKWGSGVLACGSTAPWLWHYTAVSKSSVRTVLVVLPAQRRTVTECPMGKDPSFLRARPAPGISKYSRNCYLQGLERTVVRFPQLFPALLGTQMLGRVELSSLLSLL